MSHDPIISFSADHAFLSNFFAHAITIDGDTYPTNEHAFQALKTDDPEERRRVREAPTPASAKSKGKRVTLRAGWDMERFVVMECVVRIKFADPELVAKLVDTGDREVIEGNTWRDPTWGCIKTKDGGWTGRNELGKILMKVREELKSGTHAETTAKRNNVSSSHTKLFYSSAEMQPICIPTLAEVEKTY